MIKLIENIKHFLSVNGCNCIFVIGVDKSVLTAAIMARYGKEIIRGDEYLEKIINLSLYIPNEKNKISKQYIVNKFQSQVDSDWYKDIEEEVSLFADILSRIADSNPRKIKILVTRYLLFLAFRDSNNLILDIVVRLIVFKEFFPDAYRIKEEKNKVNYFPSTYRSNTGGMGSSLSFEEITERSCKEFAIINKEDKYRSLAHFGSNLSWYIDNCFDKSDTEIDEALGSMYTNPPKGDDLDAVNKFREAKLNRSHKDYFNTVNFLFSLSKLKIIT